MLAANEARVRLEALGWQPRRIDTVASAIESHSFSAGVAPTSIEGRILQDADRLDAIGFCGIARCFYTAGRLGSRLYDLADPGAKTRPLDDGQNALDHFPKKLLTLEGSFKTRKGRSWQERDIGGSMSFIAACSPRRWSSLSLPIDSSASGSVCSGCGLYPNTFS